MKILVILALTAGVVSYFLWSNALSAAGGIVNGCLAPCPETPNCVCSCDRESDGFIAPFPLQRDGLSRIKKLVEAYPRTKIVESTDRYLHVEFTSLWIRFVDDVEFLVDPVNEAIHVRSASRVGHSDFGINRERIEELRIQYNVDKGSE